MTARQIITPADRTAWLALRVEDVTSTESSALFGLNSRTTEFELHHQKRDKVVVEIDPNERMDWGTGLQDSIAFEFARKFGVVVRKKVEYIRLPDAQMGASFDFEVIGIMPHAVDEVSPLQQMFYKHGRGLLEIKNVDSLIFRDKWIKKLDEDQYIDGKNKIVEPPPMIDIQVAHQLHVDGAAWACIGVLVGGNKGEIVYRLRDDAVGNALEARIRRFWEAVKTKQEPPPFYPQDAAFVCKLYGDADGSTFDGRGNEELSKAIDDYNVALASEKLAKEDKQVARAKALAIIGKASRAIVDGFTVSASEVSPCRVEAYDRAGYRGWKVTKKGKP